MKFCVLAVAAALLFSSCLKESIPDAMLNAQGSGGQGGGTATLSCEINGTAVKVSVPDAGNQDPSFYTLGCTKANGYSFDALPATGEISFLFFTDSLAVGSYPYTSISGPMYFITYNGTAEYVYEGGDFLTFNITSYNNGRISGNFSGQLTPLVTAGNPNNTYGASGSVKVTNGSFQNVPVFY
jgi:hypothetical protein